MVEHTFKASYTGGRDRQISEAGLVYKGQPVLCYTEKWWLQNQNQTNQNQKKCLPFPPFRGYYRLWGRNTYFETTQIGFGGFSSPAQTEVIQPPAYQHHCHEAWSEMNTLTVKDIQTFRRQLSFLKKALKQWQNCLPKGQELSSLFNSMNNTHRKYAAGKLSRSLSREYSCIPSKMPQTISEHQISSRLNMEQ